jgi:hypothetical protein
MANQGDVLQLGLVLDNIGATSPGTVASSFAQTAGAGLSVAGNVVQGAGAVTVTSAIGTPSADALGIAGGWLGVVGIGLAVVGGILTAPSSPTTVTPCTGGLVGTPNPANSYVYSGALSPIYCLNGQQPCAAPNPPLDTKFLSFTALQLAELTAEGPAELTIPVSVNWPMTLAYDVPGACDSSHTIHLSIKRELNSGLAPTPKSPDFGVARATNELDVFRPYPAASSGVQQAGFVRSRWNTAGWSTESDAFSQPLQGLPPSTQYTAISRSARHLDVFWVDQYGDLETAAWSDSAPFWYARPLLSHGSSPSVPPGAKVTGVARTPSSLDTFFVDANGEIEWMSWSGGGWTTTNITPGGTVATPGSAIAAVARTWENIDLFWIGSADGALHTAYLYPGSSGFVVDPQPKSTVGGATAGSSVAAVARTSDNLDVYFIGKDGSLLSNAWYWATPAMGWPTTPFKIGTCDPTSALSAVSRHPNTIDVVCESQNALHEYSWQPATSQIGGTGGYTVLASSGSYWQTPTLPSFSSGVDPTRVSIVARSIGNLDIFYDNGVGALQSLTWSGSLTSPGPAQFVGVVPGTTAPPALVASNTSSTTHSSTGASYAGFAGNMLDSLFVGSDGVLYDDSLIAGQGTWSRTAVGSAPIGASIAIEATQGNVNAVYADADGVLRALLGTLPSATSRSTTPAWSSPVALSTAGVMPPGGGTAIAIQGTQMDAFFVDTQGTLQVAWGPGGESTADAWQAPQPISTGSGYAPPGAHLATGTQAGTQLDVFAMDNNSNLSGFHVANGGSWAPFSIQGNFPAGGSISTTPQGSNQLDALAVDKNGELWLFWSIGLGGWSAAPLASSAVPGSQVGLGLQGSQVDALYVDATGTLQVMFSTPTAGWQGPFKIASGFAPGAPVSVGPQGTGTQLDAFVPGKDGTMKVVWVPSLNSAWYGPASLP